MPDHVIGQWIATESLELIHNRAVVMLNRVAENDVPYDKGLKAPECATGMSPPSNNQRLMRCYSLLLWLVTSQEK
jgi:hypothetical protein